MKEEIIKLSKNEDIDIIGFADIHNLIFDVDKYKLQEERNYKSTFQVGDIEDKTLSKDIYKDYNTAITIGVKYSIVECKNNDNVYVCSCAQGEDYHILLRRKLQSIEDYLLENGYKSKIYVDNNPLDERLLAYNAGLGFFGKNNLLINESIGSSFFIGVILTDAKIEPSHIVEKKCKNCNLCVKACPANAINEDGILNANVCKSYVTSKKNVGNSKLFDNCIYGCDKCLKACPYNKSNIIEIEGTDPSEILNMTEEEFKAKYESRTFFWRGKKVIDRNIQNYIKNKNNDI